MTEPPPVRRSWGAATFDRLYAERPDPWDLTGSDYERAKYAATLAALPHRHFGAIFEAGCSIGVLTAQLASRCDRLLAVDFADAALAAAAKRCAGLDNIEFEKMQLPAVWPAGRFDLIVLSEVLYFLSPDDVAQAARRTVASLAPGGHALLVNWTGANDAPCTGDEAAEAFAAAAAPLRPALQQREPQYRLDLLRAAI